MFYKKQQKRNQLRNCDERDCYLVGKGLHNRVSYYFKGMSIVVYFVLNLFNLIYSGTFSSSDARNQTEFETYKVTIVEFYIDSKSPRSPFNR